MLYYISKTILQCQYKLLLTDRAFFIQEENFQYDVNNAYKTY